MNAKEKREIREEESFSLIQNAEEVDNIPSSIWFRSEGKQKEVFEFFDKVPEGNTMRIKFPDANLWKEYSRRLRFFAGYYKEGKSLIIASRSNEAGYFIFVKKRKVEAQNDESMEIKSV